MLTEKVLQNAWYLQVTYWDGLRGERWASRRSYPPRLLATFI